MRDQATLETLYPASSARFIKGFVAQGNHVVGWCVLLATEMCDHKYFGSLKVGSLVDCFAKSGHEQQVVSFAEGILRDSNVELIVSSQSQSAWCNGIVNQWLSARVPRIFFFVLPGN